MLSNLQGDDQNLIQIMLVGQPELKDRLLKPGHGVFAQRIAVNFFLLGLTERETEPHIFYRLKKADGNPNIFSPKAIEMIYQASKGILTTINLLCDAALVYGFGYEFETIDTSVIEQVIKDQGGMGLSVETENNKRVFSFCFEKRYEKNMNQLNRLEDAVVLIGRKVGYVAT